MKGPRCVKNEYEPPPHQKKNGKATGKPSQMADSLRKQTEKQQGGKPLPIVSKTTRNATDPPRRIKNKRQWSHLRCIKSKCQQTGFPIHVASKTNGNAPPVA